LKEDNEELILTELKGRGKKAEDYERKKGNNRKDDFKS
jgi:hypothetical protein